MQEGDKRTSVYADCNQIELISPFVGDGSRLLVGSMSKEQQNIAFAPKLQIWVCSLCLLSSPFPPVLKGRLCLFLGLFWEFHGLLSLIWMSFSGGGNPKIFDS